MTQRSLAIRNRAPAFGFLSALMLPLFLAPGLVVGAASQRVAIGAGSGHLRYPDAQTTLKLKPGDTLYINPGTYQGLSLCNLSGSADAPITVLCDSNTVFTTRNPQPNDFTNIAYVRFEGFQFVDYNSTCMSIRGRSHDLLFKNFYITNASGYSFHIYDANKVFDGTKDSTFYNFKWENVVVDGKVNGAAICSSDYQPVSNLKSVLLDFEIYRCAFRHFDNTKQAFPVIGLDKCFNLQVHECSFSDIGMAESPIGHDVCICGAGYFKVFNNRFTRQWANDVRVWPMKLNALGYDGADAVNRFYNNISWEKRKYPMFEHNKVRQADLDNSSGYLSPTASEVYFNTLYRSRKTATSKDPFIGTLVDAYSPNVTIKHNLIIEPEADAPFDPARNYVYHLGAGPQPGIVAENNLVFKTLEQAGLVDISSFEPAATSPARNAATGRISYIGKDHYNHDRYQSAGADVGAVAATGVNHSAEAAQGTLLGSPTFIPSSDHPVGWRGDGTGRYPGATPPLSWSRTRTESGYTTTNILWMTPLPNLGVSMPIIVGERVFLTTEVADLVCMDKRTGRILWIRSNLEFDGLPEEERKENPAYAEKLLPLMAQLAKANTDAVDALNGQMPSAESAPPGKPIEALVKKRALEKQIHDQQLAIDKKKFERYWGQAVFGFSGPTPTSDGERVCAFFTTGVTACYDRDGHRKWIHRGHGGGSEHGNFASPLLCANRLIVWANELRAYDVSSGQLVWTNAAKAFNTYGSLFRVESGGELLACFQWGFFTRVRDGQAVWDKGAFGDSVTTPIVEGDKILARGGYPRYNDKTSGLKAFKIPATTESGKLTVTHEFREEWAEDEIPVDKQKTPFDRGYVASPLYVDGLIYQLTQGGGLIVNEAATGAVVYRKVLPLKPRTQYWNWAGCSTSPTLAGKYIYLMDNQGTTLVIQPGREYREVARNFLAESKDGKEQAQMVSTPIFEGTRMYYRTPGYLYCISAP